MTGISALRDFAPKTNVFGQKTGVFAEKTHIFKEICKNTKIGIEILFGFVYNVFIAVLCTEELGWEAIAFPKGD